MQKLNNTMFKKRVFDLTNGEYKFLQPYVNMKTKLLCRHEPCGSTFKIRPDNFLKRKHVCPVCSKVSSFTFRMVDGHVDPLVCVRCSKMHRFEILQSEIPDYAKGKIKCPICKKLAILDPQYKNAHVEFDFNFKDGHAI